MQDIKDDLFRRPVIARVAARARLPPLRLLVSGYSVVSGRLGR